MYNYTQIRCDQDGRVLTVTLNRPEKLNAWTGTMENEFLDMLATACLDDSVGCIVVTGAGRGFCAGSDIGGANQTQFDPAGVQRRAPALVTTEGREASPMVPQRLADGKPVIAAINGPAVGIGLTMALACDIRIASERARFSARFVRVGISPECGGTRNLPEVAGIETAMEMALTGRIIDASDPLARRLVSRIVPHEELLPETYKLAHEIASGPMEPVWITKRLLRRNSLEQSLRVVTDNETQLFEQVRGRAAHREAISAFLEKRDPKFN